jgi:hypothetical protein
MRVVLRDTEFVAQLDIDPDPNNDQLALLAACVLSLRRAGTGRTRGRGRVSAWLVDKSYTATHFAHFQKIVTGEAP